MHELNISCLRIYVHFYNTPKKVKTDLFTSELFVYFRTGEKGP